MKILQWNKWIVFVIVMAGCQNQSTESNGSASDSDEELQKRAIELSKQFIILDGHIDLPYRMRESGDWIDVSGRTEEGDFDYVRAKEGGLDAPFMSIYIPSSYQETGGAKELADSLIDMVNEITTRYPDKYALADSPSMIEQNFEKGLISLPMGMENGAPIEDKIKNVKYFHGRGIRYITLTHAKNNLICDSSYDTERKWNGLSEFGREVVAEMNNVGIMIDISHVSDSTFYQVIALTNAPVIASHSSCRFFTPGFERNMNDDMIRKLGENGGVIQINFATSFLDGEMAGNNDDRDEELSGILDEKGFDEGSSEEAAEIEKFNTDHPKSYSDVSKVADHIDHVVEIAGIDHVGIGSDFDGVGDSLPVGLKDASGFPNLIFELLKRGYSEEDIEKICSKNVLRVWREVERVSLM